MTPCQGKAKRCYQHKRIVKKAWKGLPQDRTDAMLGAFTTPRVQCVDLKASPRPFGESRPELDASANVDRLPIHINCYDEKHHALNLRSSRSCYGTTSHLWCILIPQSPSSCLLFRNSSAFQVDDRILVSDKNHLSARGYIRCSLYCGNNHRPPLIAYSTRRRPHTRSSSS
jgi:hypothetical protein